jgi:nitrite reductase (cytochrome c-552)
MPYERQGAMKVSSHWVRSPLLNINNACQTCHKVPEAELKARAENIQQRTYDLRNMAMDALIDLIHDIKQIRDHSTDEQLQPARDFQPEDEPTHGEGKPCAGRK